MSESPALILLCASLGYLVGSIPFSQIIAKMKSGLDLREAGYRNVGAYNVVRTTGLSWGLLAGSLDAGKGIAVLILVGALGVDQSLVNLAGLCAVLGHNYPVWLRFKGGKGVMVIAGLLFWVVPLETMLATAISFAMFRMVRLVNVSVASGFVVIIILTWLFQHYERIEILIFGAMTLIGLAYLPRFVRWLLTLLSVGKKIGTE